MSLLLRQLLHRHHLLCAPAGDEAGGGGGAADDEQDDSQEEADHVGDPEGDTDEGDGDAGESTEGEGEGDADPDAEVVIGFGEEPAAVEEDESRAPSWVRDLRQENRKKERRIRELEAQVAAAAPAPPKIEVGPRPNSKDYDLFDEDPSAAKGLVKYEAELLAWKDRQAIADAEQRQQQEAAATAQREWDARLKAVTDAGAALKVKDHADAVEALANTFSVPQMGMLIDAATDAASAAKLRHALGTNPTKAKELAAIKHPVKFIAAVLRLESQMKVTPRKAPPAPESQVRASGAGKASAVDNQVERLREKARETGDYSKVMQLKRDQAERQKKRA